MTEEIIYNKCCCYENGFCLWVKKYYETGITPKCEQVKDCYYKQLKRLEQENNSLQAQLNNITVQSNNAITALEQENKELSFAIEKCLENAGIECDAEEQALRSLPMLGTAHYKVLIEKEELEQENKELKEKIIKLSEEKGHLIVENNTLKEKLREDKILDEEIQSLSREHKYKTALEDILQICEDEELDCIAECGKHKQADKTALHWKK